MTIFVVCLHVKYICSSREKKIHKILCKLVHEQWSVFSIHYTCFWEKKIDTLQIKSNSFVIFSLKDLTRTINIPLA